MKQNGNTFVTKQRVKEIVREAVVELKDIIKKENEETAGHIIGAIMIGLEAKADKKDIEDVKAELSEVKLDIKQIKSDVSDTKRRVIDLERDTPTQREVDELKKFVGFDKKYTS